MTASAQTSAADAKIAAAVAALQNGGTATTAHAIGVPDTYLAPITSPRQKTSRGFGYNVGDPAGNDTTYQAPRYTDGMQQAALASMDPATLSQLQSSLRNAGLLDATYKQGYAGDPATLAGFTQLLTEANQSGLTWEQQLTQRLAAPQTTQAKAPFTPDAYLKPDPATLRESVRQLMKQVIGPNREPTQAELDTMTAHLGSLDRQAYDATTSAARAKYDATTANAGANGGPATAPGAVQAVDPSSQLADYMRNAYKPEIDMAKGASDLSKNRDLLQSSFLSLAGGLKGPGF